MEAGGELIDPLLASSVYGRGLHPREPDGELIEHRPMACDPVPQPRTSPVVDGPHPIAVHADDLTRIGHRSRRLDLTQALTLEAKVLIHAAIEATPE